MVESRHFLHTAPSRNSGQAVTAMFELLLVVAPLNVSPAAPDPPLQESDGETAERTRGELSTNLKPFSRPMVYGTICG